MFNHYPKIAEILTTIKGVVLATVFETDGSAPQKPGSHAIISEGSLVAGTIGGGIVEGLVIKLSGELCKTGQSVLFEHLMDNDISVKHDAICGGTIRVLIDGNPLRHLSVFERMKNSLSSGNAGVLVTHAAGSGTQVNIDRFWITEENDIPENDLFRGLKESDLRAIATASVRELKTVRGEDSLVIIEPVRPRKKLVIAGAGHIGKALSHLARLLDFETTVIDSREEFANPSNIPDADYLKTGEIGSLLRDTVIDRNTFIVIVTRGHADDAEALKPCIKSHAGYIGMIGSRTKTGLMKKEFLEMGWATEAEWTRIHTPIGLEIGSVTVEEIAVSIAAELVMVRSGRGGN